jgi:biopolymer transport protein TolR
MKERTGMTFATARGLSSQINVTPMIDILLVLLILFMAITPVSPKGLEALLPRPAERDGTLRPDSPVVLQILSTSGGGITYKINQTSIGREELRGRLQSIFSTRSTKVLFLKADKELNFSPVAGSIDLARTAGVDHVALITPELAKSR